MTVHGKFVFAVFGYSIRNQTVIRPLQLLVTLPLECPLFLDIAGAGYASAQAGHSLDKVLRQLSGLQKHERFPAFRRAVALAYVQSALSAVLDISLLHRPGHTAGIESLPESLAPA